MVCQKCGKEIAGNATVCSGCRTADENNALADNSPQSSESSIIDGTIIEHETVQKKKRGIPELILLGVAGFESFHALGMLLNREAMVLGTYSFNSSAASDSFVIAAICFVIAMIVHKKRRLTDHYKFKCPRCSEEKTVSADKTSTFNCSKCKKTMAIVNGKIKTIE